MEVISTFQKKITATIFVWFRIKKLKNWLKSFLSEYFCPDGYIIIIIIIQK